MEFIDREAQNKSHIIINFDDGTSKSATIVRDDNPTVGGTPISAAIFKELSWLIELCKTEAETNKQNLADIIENINNITIESLSVDSTNLPNATFDKDNNKIIFTLPQPKQGKSYRSMGIWSSTQEYVNNDLYTDTVSFNGCSYYCKKSGYNHQPADNTDNEYWGLMCARGSNASVNIIDNLLSDNVSYVLSANQGRILKGLLDEHSAMLSTINSTLQSLSSSIQSLETKLNNMLNGVQTFNKVSAQEVETQQLTTPTMTANSSDVNLSGSTIISGTATVTGTLVV